MAQNVDIVLPVRHYARVDFTALRARFNRVPLETITQLYYNEDDLAARSITSPADLGDWLTELRDHLAEKARIANPHLTQLLSDARTSNVWSSSVVSYLVQASEQDGSTARPTDAVSVWFKPRISGILRGEGVRTLEDLKHLLLTRGRNWWRAIPRVGAGRAKVIERWLASQPSLGKFEFPSEALIPVTEGVVLGPGAPLLVPLERITSVTSALDGRDGHNRNQSFCLISARTDIEAIRAYLSRFSDREKTYRAYQKELERYLLWCVGVRGIPMSSVLTDDCEAYKQFLKSPDPAWVGPKTLRGSPRWRPFVGSLSPSSQRYATQALRMFFEWLVRVRYLGGNPWITVKDPVVDQKENVLDIDKAIPRVLWSSVTDAGGWLDQACEGSGAKMAQYRLARAAILLIGTTGIRREEAANATRDKLKPLPPDGGERFWELAVLGKRQKWRTVFMPDRVVQALRAHWVDRGHDFEFGMHDLALLSPVVIPATPKAKAKHLRPACADGSGGTVLTGNGFSPEGLYLLVKAALVRLADDVTLELSEPERELLKRAAPHALRHTFATQAAAQEMKLPVLQRLMGHASLSTTSIYVQAERAQSIAEVKKLFRGS